MKIAKRINLIFTIVMATLLCFVIFNFISYNISKEREVKETGEKTAVALRNQIDEILLEIEQEGNRLSQLFGSQEFTRKQVEAIVKESSLSIKAIQGVTACYEPYAFSKAKRLYCPYYDKNTSDYFFVESKYDYSIKGNKSTDWYTGARDNGAMWNEPYFGEGVQDWFVDYSAPFYYTNGANKGKVRGTITLSFVLGGFKNLVHKLSLGKTGYGTIVSNKGTFLVHPINEYIGVQSIQKLAEKEESEALKKAYENIIARNTGRTEFFDEQNHSDVIFHYDKIPTSNWGIGLLFFKNDLLGGNAERNKHFMKLLLFASLFIIGLVAMWFMKDEFLDRKEIWQLSISLTILLLINLFMVCYLRHTTNFIALEKSQPITDITTLNSFVNSINQETEITKEPKYKTVPTGIYIEKMDFTDTYNIGITGKVWQKYPAENTINPPEIGIYFPQLAADPEGLNMEETYREIISENDGKEAYLLVGWDFTSIMRLNLNYSNFPFDKRRVDIEFKPIKSNDYLIFTPDLEAYNFTNPSKKSGINPKLEISGNDIVNSYFNYSIQSYNTDFGYHNKAMFEEVPILHFNIDLKRRLLNAFVTYLIPIFITLIMVYILIYSVNSKSEGQGIIEAMAAFFFVLVFSHIDLRKDIGTEDLMFMEFFYFASYLMLILTTFNLFLYTKGKVKIFKYNENQIFEALFFPMFLTIILVVAYLKFY